MTFFADHRTSRWAVPAAAVVLIAGGTLVASRTASADAGLPARSAAQLLADVRGSVGQSLSGTVVQTADLGLPQIPGLGGRGSGSPAATGGGASLTSVISGTHTWRVWAGGPTRSRVALVSGAGESDVIRNGSDVWVWSSAEKTAVHHTLTAKDAAAGAPSGSPTDLPKTPAEAADKALAAIDPSTSVTTAGTAVVAGRQAYELVLDPRTDGTRVAQVRIAVDAEKHVPLRVQVYSTQLPNPAVEVGFTSVDFAAPDARQFAFTPPADTTVTEGTQGAHGTTKAGTQAEPKVVGTGWTSVAVATMPAQLATDATQNQLQGMLSALPKVSGDWGSGRVIDGTLLSAVLTDDGRVAVGAVDPQALFAALKSS
jgi:outer membrane lipoprotein-sorting protein